jgi:hypothetical protein
MLPMTVSSRAGGPLLRAAHAQDAEMMRVDRMDETSAVNLKFRGRAHSLHRQRFSYGSG